MYLKATSRNGLSGDTVGEQIVGSKAQAQAGRAGTQALVADCS